MERNCQLMDNGDVYEILQDGTIHKIGNMTTPPANNNRVVVAVLSIIWVLTLIISIAMYNDVKSNSNRNYRQYTEYRDKWISEESKLNSLKSELDKMDSPIVISKIEVRNSGESYNQRIYSGNTTYINGKIYYFSTKSQNITLNIKFYKNNILSQGSGEWYHIGFSYPIKISTSAYQQSTFECNGWGSKYQGHWTAGDYRYEVWYGDKCLGVKHFTIY